MPNFMRKQDNLTSRTITVERVKHQMLGALCAVIIVFSLTANQMQLDSIVLRSNQMACNHDILARRLLGLTPELKSLL